MTPTMGPFMHYFKHYSCEIALWHILFSSTIICMIHNTVTNLHIATILMWFCLDLNALICCCHILLCGRSAGQLCWQTKFMGTLEEGGFELSETIQIIALV